MEQEEAQIANELAEAINSAKEILEGPVLRSGSELNRVPRVSSDRLNQQQGSQLENARKAYQKRLSGIQGQLTKVEKERDDALSALSALRSSLDEDACRQALDHDRLSENETVKKLEMQLKAAKEREVQLQTAVVELTESQKQKAVKVHDLEEQLAHSSDDERVKALRSQVSELSTEAIRREKSLSSKDSVITELRKKFAQISDHLCEKDSQLENSKTKILTLETDLKSSGVAVETKANQLRQLEQERAKMKQELTSLERKVEEDAKLHLDKVEALEAKVATLRRELQTNNAVKAELQTKTEEMHSHRMDLQDRLDSADALGEKLQRQRISTQSKASICFLRTTNIFHLGTFYSRWLSRAIERKNGRASTRVQKLEEELATKRASLVEVSLAREQEQSRSTSLLDSAKQDCERLTAELELAKKAAAEDAELKRNQVASYKKTVSEMQQQNSARITEVVNTMEEEKKGLEEAVEREQESKSKVESQLAETKASLRQLSDERDALKVKVVELEDKNSEELAEKQKDIRGRAEAWKEEREELKNKIRALASEKLTFSDQIDEMETKLEVALKEGEAQKARAEAAEALASESAGTHEAAQFHKSLEILEKAHKQALSEVEDQNVAAKAELSQLKEDKSKTEQAQIASNDVVSRSDAARWARYRIHMSMLMGKSSDSSFATRWFYRWALKARAKKLETVRKMAQRSLSLLQTKADSFKRIADEAIARSTSLETENKELQRTIESSPRRKHRIVSGEVEVVDVSVGNDGRDHELQEAKRRANHAENKAKTATRLMESAKTQIKTVVVELQKARDKEQGFFNEINALNEQLTSKEAEQQRLKSELKRALSRWNEAVAAGAAQEHSEFVQWLLSTRAPLVADICHLHLLCRGIGGEEEALAQQLVYKYLTDPEKHHQGISVAAPRIPSPSRGSGSLSPRGCY